MIRTIVHREYLLSCDGCGRAGASGGTPDAAGQEVRNLGWQALTPWRGFAFLATWLCPACQRQRQGLAANPATSGA
jgi:hypothetical protein